jgi:hypothetical protein
MPATFGPIIIERRDEPGKLIARCLSGDLYCRGYIGGSCVWNQTEDSKSRKLPADTNEAPDWCQYKESALREAEEMPK